MNAHHIILLRVLAQNFPSNFMYNYEKLSEDVKEEEDQEESDDDFPHVSVKRFASKKGKQRARQSTAEAVVVVDDEPCSSNYR